MKKQEIEDRKKRNKLTRTNARREYEQYTDLLNEQLKPFKTWVVNDPKMKPHYELFNKWFKKIRDNGLQIGIQTGAARGTILLLERDWMFLREAFLKRTKTQGVRGARGYGRKNK